MPSAQYFQVSTRCQATNVPACRRPRLGIYIQPQPPPTWRGGCHGKGPLPLATLVTPNKPETELLSRIADHGTAPASVTTFKDVVIASERLPALGSKVVFVESRRVLATFADLHKLSA